MRKFLIYYKTYKECYNFTKDIVINQDEKANIETFKNKLSELGIHTEELFAWSLVEE